MPCTYFSLCIMITDAHLDVLGDGRTFLLRKAGHNGYENLPLAVGGQDVLLLKEDWDALRLQFPNVLKAVESVTGETADAFGNDRLNSVLFAVPVPLRPSSA